MSALKVSAVWILFHLFSQVCYCQCQEIPYVSFRGESLANHSYVDLSLVNNTASGSVQCHTDLGTCCTSGQGPHRGDWYFPNGSRLMARSGGSDIYEKREAERVDLRRRNDGTASGIYHCFIATVAVHDDSDPSVREHVYVGLYDSGATDTLDFDIVEASTPQFTLTCISTDGPATTVTWTRDSVTVTEGTETVLDDPVTAQYTHTLTVTGRLAGLYTCTVANNKPSNDSSSLRVNVASAPDNLSLKQDGESNILVSWTTPTPLGDTSGYRVDYTTDSNTETSTVSDASTSTISLTSLEPGQHYSILIIGLSEHLPSEPVTSFIFLYPLPRDVLVTVNTVTATTISLRVSISNYDSRTSYNISVAWSETLANTCSGAGDFHREQYTPNKEYSIVNLNGGSDYDLVVTISNAAGNVTSDRITVTTITVARVPSAAPVNVMASNLTVETTSSITITWKPLPCIDRNGDIGGYVVMYRELSSGLVNSERITDATEVEITGLKLSTRYEISVAAFNSVGTGPFTNASFDTDVTIPPSSGGSNAGTDCSATIAVSAVSLALNITLATVILILILRMRRSSTKDELKSSKAGTSVHLDVPVTPNEAYALHQSGKSSEDTTYEMVK